MRYKARIAALLASSLFVAAAPAIPASASVDKKKKHCVQFKTYKKNGKSYKRCAKYK